jgi:glucan biosynthesis protein
LNRLNFKNISLTIVATKHPLNLLKFLRKHFGLSLIQSGIYRVEHTTIPTQIIVSNELSESENLWLTSLKSDITITQLKQVATEIVSHEHDATVKAYYDVVISTNFQTYKKLMEIPGMKKTLTQHLEEMGYVDQWRAEGQAEEHAKWQADKIEIAAKLKHYGMDHKTIMKVMGLSLREVKRLK